MLSVFSHRTAEQLVTLRRLVVLVHSSTHTDGKHMLSESIIKYYVVSQVTCIGTQTLITSVCFHFHALISYQRGFHSGMAFLSI